MPRRRSERDAAAAQYGYPSSTYTFQWLAEALRDGFAVRVRAVHDDGAAAALDRGALACGFETDRWTLRRVADLIQREFNITYHPHYLNRLLASLGFSPQKPLPRAGEQDEALVRAWLSQDWARIKKGTAPRRHHRVFR